MYCKTSEFKYCLTSLSFEGPVSSLFSLGMYRHPAGEASLWVSSSISQTSFPLWSLQSHGLPSPVSLWNYSNKPITSFSKNPAAPATSRDCKACLPARCGAFVWPDMVCGALLSALSFRD